MENNNIEIDNEIRSYFNELLLKSEISVDEEKKEKMLGFLELMHEKNKIMNLTAIRDKKGMTEKHFIDSLFLTEVIQKEEKKLIDVGTGAGFPGLVLAIYYPEKEFLLVDSVRKKIDFINEVIEKLNIKNMLRRLTSNKKIQYDPNNTFEYLVYSRILDPHSKYKSLQDFKNYYGYEKTNYQDIIKTMDIFPKYFEFFQNFLYENSKDIIERDTSVLYYDCTNYFFETDKEDTIRKYGVSKEHRPNPIVQMGLFMDGSGIPLFFKIFPGNVNEQTTTLKLEEKIVKTFKLSNFVYCSDAGLGSNETRLFNSIENRDFLVTQSLKKLKKDDLNCVLTDDNWYDPETMRNDISLSNLKDDDEKVYIKILPVNNPIDIGLRSYTRNMQIKKKSDFKQTVIVTFSKKMQLYQRSIRENQIERAQNLILKNTADKESESSPKRFIKRNLDSNGKYTLDLDKITYEEQFDGFYAVATSLDKDYKDIVKILKRRWQIEESFRILKTNLKARPVFHSREDRIKTHFMICYVALLIYRILEKKLGYKYTTNEIIETLKNMEVTNLKNDQMHFVSLYDGADIIIDLDKICNKSLHKGAFLYSELNAQKNATFKNE